MSCQAAATVSAGTVIQSFGITALAMARARSYSHVTKMLLIAAAVSGLDAPYLARRGVLARALLVAPGAALAGVVAPGAANAGIADQLEAASRASEITYSQNGRNMARMAAGDNSMGAKKNTSLEPRAMKRRATMGCKSGKVLAQAKFADEKSCTVAVLDFSSANFAWARTLPDLQPIVARRFMARGSKEVFFLAPIELSPAAILAMFLPFCE